MATFAMPSRRADLVSPPPEAYLTAGGRDLRIDFLRGYLVFAMVVDHVRGPSWLYAVTGGNRFYTSAAEGFIFVSGLVAGTVYRRLIERDGLELALRRVLDRAAQLYLLAVGLTMVFLPLSEALALPWAQGIDLSNPLAFVVSVVTLHRTYYLVDVPLLYALLLLVAPLALVLLSQGRPDIVLGASWVLWGLYQLFPEQAALPWPIAGNYLFHFSAWQVLFFTGLAIGYYRQRTGSVLGRLPRRPLLVLLGLGTAGLAGLYLVADRLIWSVPTDAADPALAHQHLQLLLLDVLFSKADLRPGRLVAFAVVFGFLFILTTELWGLLRRALGWLFLPLGQHALYAYTAHVILAALVALALAPFDLPNPGPPSLNAAIQLVSVGLIWTLARFEVLLPTSATRRWWMASPVVGGILLLVVLPRDPSPGHPGLAAPPVEPDPTRARVARAFGTPVPRAMPQQLGTPVPLRPPTTEQPAMLAGGEPRASQYVGPTQGTFRELRFYSPALDADMHYLIYLPPDYGTAGRRYPVLYMLHGASGDKEERAAYGLIDAADQSIRTGELPPLLVVLPQGDWGYWANHAAGPRWGDYLAEDLVRHVDASYRTLPEPAHRAIGGLSMGAWGALHQAFTRPDVFGVVGAHSPALRTDDGSLHFLGSGEEFARRDPLALARTARDVHRLRIWIDIGDEDPWLERARLLHQHLEERGVAHEWVVFPGGHEGAYWQEHVLDYLRFYGPATTRR